MDGSDWRGREAIQSGGDGSGREAIRSVGDGSGREAIRSGGDGSGGRRQPCTGGGGRAAEDMEPEERDRGGAGLQCYEPQIKPLLHLEGQESGVENTMSVNEDVCY